jgi:hypothetical protein
MPGLRKPLTQVLRHLYMRFFRILTRRFFALAIILFVLLNSVDVFLVHMQHNSKANEGASKDTGRIFIASIHWNNEAILRSAWNQALLDLVECLGSNNVFVSVYESGECLNLLHLISNLIEIQTV